MKITLLLDNLKSWYYPYAQELKEKLEKNGNEVCLLNFKEDIVTGDLAFFLSCEKIIKKDIRNLNKLNLVVHSSNLPNGKGWSPLTYQILEGKGEVFNTLFEAVDSVDAGNIYMQNVMKFDGSELLDELHKIQGEKINELVLEFVQKYPNVTGKKQSSQETFYTKRGPKDSELDVNKTIAEQFDLLRVVDNERYPAFFQYRGHKYILKIEKE